MNRFTIHFLLFISLIFTTKSLLAQAPDGYYNTIDGKQSTTLKTTLHYIIKDHTVISYKGLWDAFRSTDKKPNGKVWDMYSNIPNGTPPYEFTFGNDQCGNYSGEGSCYNREHSFPKSWFDDASPMYSDLFHLYPTDGYVNGRRGNNPFGEVGIATWTSKNGSKLGQNTFGSYRGTVFEPIDEYKGDFARTYFYMATRYQDKISGWSSDMLSGDSYTAFAPWALDLLLKWHRNDPVSTKEIDRNNAVFSYQYNRNPFIDIPDLVEYIWGNKKNETFYLNGDTPTPPEEKEVELINTTFKASLDPFTEYSVIGSQTWRSNSTYGAMISGFQSNESHENEDWLISPSIDLTDIESTELTFQHAINKGDVASVKTNHTLWISDNYTSENPINATWTEISIPNYPAGNTWTYVESGSIQFPNNYLNKTNIHFAFKYVSTTSDAATWEITDLILTGKKRSGSSIDDINKEQKITIYSSNGDAIIELNDYTTKQIEIYDMVGRLVVSQSANTGVNIIPLEKGKLYIVKAGNSIRKIYIN